MNYTDDELPFLNAFFESYNDCADRTVGMVYADFLDEQSRPEGELVRALCQLDAERKNHELLKAVHRMNHRILFEEIRRKEEHFPLEAKLEGDKVVTKKIVGLPLSVIVNGWKTQTIAYFPPVKLDRRAVAYLTHDQKPSVTHGTHRVIAAKTWTEVRRMPPAVTDNERAMDAAVLSGNDQLIEEVAAEGRRQARGFGVYGEAIDHATVPGEIKKAMFIGYLNHVRKDAEKKCLFGPPRLNKKLRKQQNGTAEVGVP